MQTQCNLVNNLLLKESLLNVDKHELNTKSVSDFEQKCLCQDYDISVNIRFEMARATRMFMICSIIFNKYLYLEGNALIVSEIIQFNLVNNVCKKIP